MNSPIFQTALDREVSRPNADQSLLRLTTTLFEAEVHHSSPSFPSLHSLQFII